MRTNENENENGSGFHVPGSRFVFAFAFLCSLFAVPGSGLAQAPMLTLKATSANVAAPGTPVSIRLLRWSTDLERTPMVTALAPPPPPPAAVSPAAAPGAPDGPVGVAAEPGARAGRAGRAAGRGGRGGRGAPAPPNPIANLATAIAAAPTIGYLWTDGVTGYSIKYAWRASLANGAERIVLATDRRLGAHSPAWALAANTPAAPNYDFTIIEMELDAKGLGEGKTSLTTRVLADATAKTLALDGYAAAPTLLKVTR
jgi:hypothetical protein